MLEVLAGLLVSFGVVFVAELGDKSQLMALAFAARHKAWHVIAGVTVATAIVHLASVAIGSVLGEALPVGWVNVVAAVAFFGFAAWTLRGDSLSAGEQEKADRAAGSVILAVGVAFFLAELGDKTMLATVTLAAPYDWLGVWIGSTAGMVAADTLAIVVGRVLSQRLPERIISYGAAALFSLFGAVLLVDGIAHLNR